MAVRYYSCFVCGIVEYVVFSYFEIFKFIIDNIVDKNPEDIWGNTPLHFAARQGHFKICKYILQNVVDKDPENKYGETPFQCVSEEKLEEYFKILESS